MPGTPADHRSSPNSGQGTGNLNFLYQRHRSRLQGLENPQLRPVPAVGNHGLGRQDPYGEEKHRIYPTKIMRTSPNYRSGATNAITSPLLSALGSTSSTAAQYTSDWARSLPFTSHNQQQLGSSPPPISLITAGRDISGQSIPSTSPPNMRPQSHPNQYQNFGGRHPQGSQNSPRRSSLYSQYGSPYGHVPLPHEDQPHFHPGGLPDLDSIVPQSVTHQIPGLVPGDKGYFCGFDTLSNAGHGPSASAEMVLLCGFEGGLATYKVTTKMIHRIGLLENVRGGVIGAKILPWTLRSDPGSSGRPYVALIVHGPVLEDADAGSSGGSDAQSSDSNPLSNRPQGLFLPDVIKYYRTTVEVYSLSTRKHVATIFESPNIPVEYSSIGELRIPKPFGDLSLDAKGKFLVVTSGESGEIFIYSPYTHDSEVNDLSSIHCIGKLWTSIQRRETKIAGNPPSPNGVPNSVTEETEIVKPVPIFALSERWIALIPPAGTEATTRFSIKGKALLASTNGVEARPPGIKSHAPPPTRPDTTCAIDVPEGGMGDTLMDRVSREVTQRVMRGAQWVGEKSRQYWTSYWNPQEPGQFHQLPQNMPPHHDSAFPPTHGHNALPPTNSPAPPTQVSIFDLERFIECEISGYAKRTTKAALTPLATFELVSGCSHLSFAPHGYHLLTASRKGDEYVIWNLLRMVHPPSPTSVHNPVASTEPYVRQSLRLTRMTTASVSDVIWDALPPFHKKFAIVTGAGTIHAHLVPDGAFTWPPPRNSGRRSRRLANGARYDQQRRDSESDIQRPSTAVLGTAVGMASSTANWLRGVGTAGASNVSASGVTGRPKSLSAATASTAASAVGTSTRAVRAGLTASANMVANGANTMYRSGENKLHVSGLTGADVGTGTAVMFFRGSKKDHSRLLFGSKSSGTGKGDAARRHSVSVGSASSANGNALYGFDDDEDDDENQDSGSKRACFLAVVASGTIRIYPVRETTIPRKGMPAIPLAAVGKRSVEFVLYKIPDDVFAPAFRKKVERRFGLDKEPGKEEDTEAEHEEQVGGEWLPRAPTAAQNLLQVPSSHHSRSQSSPSAHPQGSSSAGKSASSLQPQAQIQQKLKPPKNRKGRASPSPPAPTSVPEPIPVIQTPPSMPMAPIRLRMESHPHGNGNNWHATVEAETNPPYRPFHTDGCVLQFNEGSASLVEELEASRETARAASPIPPKRKSKAKRRSKVVEEEQEEIGDYDSHSRNTDDLSSSAIHDPPQKPKDKPVEVQEDENDEKWVFGMPLPKGTPLFAPAAGTGTAMMGAGGLESSNVIPVFGEDPYQIDVDGVESDIRVVEGPAGEQVVVTTVRRTSGLGQEDEFFEEGCEIVDWADDRV